jgi:hypothetical protein
VSPLGLLRSMLARILFFGTYHKFVFARLPAGEWTQLKRLVETTKSAI